MQWELLNHVSVLQRNLTAIVSKYTAKEAASAASSAPSAYFCFYGRPFIIFIRRLAAYFRVRMNFLRVRRHSPDLLYFHAAREKVSPNGS